ncbi:MAG: endonuclease/exonuclease/phosphatase family protein [Pseudomonadota bacterium]
MRICTWNLEWFDDHFENDNTFKNGARGGTTLADIRESIAAVIRVIDPDAIMLIEAPGTTASTGKSTVQCLEHFAQEFNLRLGSAIIGFPSNGRQEIALWFDPNVCAAEHDPTGEDGDRMDGPFDQEFVIDSDLDGIKEIYSHYRPPFEAKITPADGSDPFWMVGVHAKSKGIFSKNDLLHYKREVEKNRRRLFAECSHIRRRVENMLADEKPVVVLGDINDGPGMDYAEMRFGRSAVELVMGTVFEPRKILTSHLGEPKWGAFGFEPSSARFQDRFTEDYVNVLIDHILASEGIAVADTDPHLVWNPFQLEAAKPHKTDLLRASDHFPVTLDLA